MTLKFKHTKAFALVLVDYLSAVQKRLNAPVKLLLQNAEFVKHNFRLVKHNYGGLAVRNKFKQCFFAILKKRQRPNKGGIVCPDGHIVEYCLRVLVAKMFFHRFARAIVALFVNENVAHRRNTEAVHFVYREHCTCVYRLYVFDKFVKEVYTISVAVRRIDIEYVTPYGKVADVRDHALPCITH